MVVSVFVDEEGQVGLSVNRENDWATIERGCILWVVLLGLAWDIRYKKPRESILVIIG